MKKLLIASLLLSMFGIAGHAATFNGDCAPQGYSTDTNPDTTDTDFAYAGSGAGAVLVKGILGSYTGIVQSEDVFLAPATASSNTITVAAVDISTTALVANGTSWTLLKGDYTDVVEPRNLVAVAYFSTGGATTTASIPLVITGVSKRGEVISTALTVSTTSATGVKAFASITSMSIASGGTISGASTANVKIIVGTGTKMGLKNNVIAAGDIVKVIENGATSTTYTLDATYDTIAFAAAPDGSKNYKVIYKVKTR